MILAKTSYLILFAALFLQACSSSPSSSSSSSSSRYKVKQDYGPSKSIDVSHVKNAIPKVEPKSRYGNPKEYNVLGKSYQVRDSSKNYAEIGLASWYGNKFHGHRTSNGETYDMYAMTAAHKTLPLPTYVRVTHLENYSAAKKLGVTATGTAKVKVVAIDPKTYQQNHPYQPKIKRTAALTTKTELLSKSKLYLQAGAFSDKKNAVYLQKRLIRLFTAKQVHAEFTPDEKMYRIRIGPLLSTAHAEKVSTLLLDKGISTKKITLD